MVQTWLDETRAKVNKKKYVQGMMCEWGQGGREWRGAGWVWSLMDPSTDKVRTRATWTLKAPRDLKWLQ